MRAEGVLLFLTAFVALAACATAPGYPDLVASGDLRVSEVGNVLLVEAAGRDGVEMEQLLDYALLSAAEAAAERNVEAFVVVDLQSWNERAVQRVVSNGYVPAAPSAGLSAQMAPVPSFDTTAQVRLQITAGEFGVQALNGAASPTIGAAFETEKVIEELSARYALASTEGDL